MNRRGAIKGIIAAVAGVVTAPWRGFAVGGIVVQHPQDTFLGLERGPSWDESGDVVADIQEAFLAIRDMPLPPTYETWYEPALDAWLNECGYSSEEAEKYKQKQVAAGRIVILGPYKKRIEI